MAPDQEIITLAHVSSGIVCFLREAHVATHTLRIGPPSQQSA